ncbi:MAG TPA: outer membrane protein transport protein [Polyangiaceae bacterium]|jgi:long-chain fatty acid transport protein|nr:outer membrane protein transport protein [Polyangiaceae bacterium]
MRRANTLLGLGLLSVCAALVPRSAQASGFAVAHFASEHGHPTTDNATALYFNPAALTLSDGLHVFADLSVAVRRVTYDRPHAPTDAPDPPDAQGANVGRAELVNPLVNPVLAASLKIGKLSLGAGFFTPFGGMVSWDKRNSFANSRYPGIVDGVSRFQSIEGDIVTSQFMLGGALRVAGTGLSLGVSGSVMRSWIDDVRAWSNGGNDVTTEGRSLLQVSGYAVGFGLGALYEVTPNVLWLGLSYQSRPNVSGGMRLHGSLQNDIGGPSSANVDMVYDLPDIIRWGARYRPRQNLELRAFGDYTRFSAFKNQCVVRAGDPCTLGPNGAEVMGGQVLQNVPRDWHDSFGVRLGVSIWPSSRFEFFSGMGYESSAVPDRTFDPGLPDFDGVSFALGGRLALSRRVHAALSYTQFVYIPRDVHSGLAQFPSPSQSPDASGHYTQQVGVGNLNVDMAF